MLLTAFILGLAGSLHCAGMCSPLAFAVTNFNKSGWLNRILYNLGRIFTYGMLGVLVSTIGVVLPLEKFQYGLSIGMGVMLISIGALGAGKFQSKKLSKILAGLSLWLKKQFAIQIKKKNKFSMILLGILNGLLPCGLTLIALATCVITPTALDGFYFMLAFGAGTLPVMIGFLSAIQWLVNRFSLSFAKINMIMMIVAGSLLIARVAIPSHPQATASMNASEIVCP